MHESPFRPNDRGMLLPDTVATQGDEHDLNQSWKQVPWRTIVAVVAIVLGTYLVMELVLITVRIITWIVIAGFFAVVLAPMVRRVQEKLGGRRNLATGIVVFSTLTAVVGLLLLFLLPVRNQLVAIITDLPGTVQDAASGRGAVGRLVTKLGLNSYVQDNQKDLIDAANRLSGSTADVVQAALGFVLGFVTITVITFLFLSQSDALGRTALSVVPHRRRDSVRRVAVDAAGAISGYMIGNLLISLVAGTTAFVCLVALGVPSPVVLALFVAFADLIPLVGAIIGAAVAVLAAFLHNSTAGVIALIFFVVYQQIENSVLYPAIMSRRVKVNPLVVLLSVLLGAEVFGMIGALLAVPASGAMLVIAKEIREERQIEKLHLPPGDHLDRSGSNDSG